MPSSTVEIISYTKNSKESTKIQNPSKTNKLSKVTEYTINTQENLFHSKRYHEKSKSQIITWHVVYN